MPRLRDKVAIVSGVKSMYLTCRAVIPHMIKQGGGSIINKSSTAAIRFTYANVAYSASKGAVSQLTQNIGVQYASKGVRCNAVLPGYIATPRIVDRLKRSNPEDYDDKIRERQANVPSGRLGTGWDVAYGVLYLASDGSQFDYGGKLGTMYKDVSLCLEEARDLKVPMWLGSQVVQMWFQGMADGRGDDDYTSLIKVIETWANVVVGGNESGPAP